MIDEPGIRLRARQFMAQRSVEYSYRPFGLCQKVNAKLDTEEPAEGESGYTLVNRSGKASIVVNELENLERQRFSICHEVAAVLDLASDHKAVPPWSYAKARPQ